ncbi:hypothetical protein BU25DRAFT_423983 [Macroventuria anomochaeta]|uniref:Uncharacterized protein n=1 Tax=Macroventuria anomochaeta TaxID=301207 RepID=A0ACB6RR47_9PLEO|nr:uncharacterized protein BU25DRAFT_423983 [Macroventuria anomochaeta]KAF2624516.1 hypothetical protein BU25DRAFT_423983 [Macroventuria anomochaeta]
MYLFYIIQPGFLPIKFSILASITISSTSRLESLSRPSDKMHITTFTADTVAARKVAFFGSLLTVMLRTLVLITVVTLGLLECSDWAAAFATLGSVAVVTGTMLTIGITLALVMESRQRGCQPASTNTTSVQSFHSSHMRTVHAP